METRFNKERRRRRKRKDTLVSEKRRKKLKLDARHSRQLSKNRWLLSWISSPAETANISMGGRGSHGGSRKGQIDQRPARERVDEREDGGSRKSLSLWCWERRRREKCLIETSLKSQTCHMSRGSIGHVLGKIELILMAYSQLVAIFPPCMLSRSIQN